MRCVQLVVLFGLILITKTGSEKLCRVRNESNLYEETYFRYKSGGDCYMHINPNWLVGKQLHPKLGIIPLTPNATIQYTFAFLKLDKPVMFDYINKNATNIIRSLFIEEDYYNKWLLCAETAMDCCHNYLNEENMTPSMEYPCPALWDGFTCYPKTKRNTAASMPCPAFLTSGDSFVCDLQSVKYCLDTDWNHVTDYAPCASSRVYRERYIFHMWILVAASIIMVPSVIIYFSFRKLRQLRFVMHRNLIIAILVKNLLVVVSKNVVILDAISTSSNHVMEEDGVGCKILAILESVSKNTIFTCMSADAYFLHRVIVRSFSGEPNIYIIYAAISIASTVPTIVWAILMGVHHKTNCWMADSESWFQWITDGYKYTMLVINVVLLIDIIRVLYMKLGKNTNKKQTRKALKATLILLPLFGVPLLITGQRDLVDLSDCVASDVYYYITYFIEAAQGVLLSLFFCYFNGEVIAELKNVWRKFNNRFGIASRRPTTGRRTTGVTNISSRL